MKHDDRAHWRPAFHFTPPAGWMNDPNGLLYFQNRYHLFYQHYPYSCEWGSMHWGHAASEDLFHWSDLPVALAPDQPYDRHPQGGCFSGSAFADGERMALLYTGMVPDAPLPASQNLAFSDDGVHFSKYAGNPVIPTPPAPFHPREFRDPKVFRHDGRWYLVAGASTGRPEEDGDGAVLLYRSDDVATWEFVSVLLRSEGRYGSMIECPDLFFLDGKWVLLFSPMYRHDLRQCIWLTGSLDLDTGRFCPEREGVCDYGFDFYAPQAYPGPGGRRTAIGWMGAWDWMPWFTGHGPTAREGWRGAMSVPRECRLDASGALCFAPAPQLKALRAGSRVFRGFRVDTRPARLAAPLGNQYELRIAACVEDIASRHLTIRLFEGGHRAATIDLSLQGGVLLFDRGNADDAHSSGKAFCPLSLENGLLDLCVIVDRSTVEVFADGGRHCLSATVYPADGQCGVSLSTPYRSARLSGVELHGLKSSVRQ